MTNIATHKGPAWGPKSNFIIRADLAIHGMPGRSEQVWARRIDNTTFEVCCIPFFTYGLALGDKVETDAEYLIQRITEKGGHKTLRVAVAIKDEQDRLHEILHEWVDNTGLLYEWYSPGYLAVDLPPDAQHEAIFPTLGQLSEKGEICIEIDE
jgi:hypothetical protein